MKNTRPPEGDVPRNPFVAAVAGAQGRGAGGQQPSQVGVVDLGHPYQTGDPDDEEPPAFAFDGLLGHGIGGEDRAGDEQQGKIEEVRQVADEVGIVGPPALTQDQDAAEDEGRRDAPAGMQ